MNYKDIQVKHRSEYNTFSFNGKEIKVLKYLPVEEKYDLIMTAIQKSYCDGICNYIKLRTFFNLNILYLYTNIDFDIETRADEGTLFDECETSGLIYQVRNTIEKAELINLEGMFEKCLADEKAYRNTAASIISKLVDDLPKNAETAKNIVETFDQNKYQQVMEFAKSLGSK